MKYGQRLLIYLMLAAMLFLICFSASAEEENLLFNGSFEEIGPDGMPEDWFTDAYHQQPGVSRYGLVEDPDEEFSFVAQIQNTSLNDARFAQIVDVEPETLYCLSGYIKAEGIEEGHGANLSVEGVYSFSEEVYETHGEWRYVEYYGETGPDQYELTVFVRLGGYSGESKGKAWFDRISLKKVDAAPGNIVADMWFRPSEENEPVDDFADEEPVEFPAWPQMLALSILFSLLLIAVLVYTRDGRELHASWLKTSGPFWAVMGTALLLRMVISYLVEGYMVDVNCFRSWGATMAESGPVNFYQTTSFCDYPPLYMLVLGVKSMISTGLSATVEWSRVIFRFVPCLCDIAALCFLQTVATREYRDKQAWIRLVLMLMAFNPVSIVNSAAWGQMDSVLCVLLLLTVMCAVRKKWIVALPLYVVSVLIKPQALMLGILGLLYIVKEWIEHPESRKEILKAVGVSIAVMILALLPFSLKQKPDWIITLYGKTLGSYNYATLNTANFYYLLGANWISVDGTAHILASVILAVLCAVLALYVRQKSEKPAIGNAICAVFVLFAAAFMICLFLGASWAVVGGIAMGAAFVIVIGLALIQKEPRFLVYLSALLFLLLYVFGIKMHERYIYPAILFLIAAWCLYRDRRILALIIVISFTVFLNVGIVLDNSIRLGSESGHLLADTVWLADILSVLNVLCALYAVRTGIGLAMNEEMPDMKEPPRFFPCWKKDGNKAEPVQTADRSWKRKDTLILAGITLVYSVITLMTLGSTKAPQRPWISTYEDEQVILDLGEHQDEFTMLYFAQVSYSDFSVAVSDDLHQWSPEVPADMNQGQCWKWKYVTESYQDDTGKRSYWNADMEHVVRFSGRYLRISALQGGLRLNEVLIRDRAGQPISVTVYDRFTEEPEETDFIGNPEYLIDEPGTIEAQPNLFAPGHEEDPPQPSWWNSSYFDEIYHARTGWEFIQGTTPYETSHPPLGKLAMSLCIMIFGMTPFGWRLAGALAGIAMIPGMYLLGKQLTGKTKFAFVAALLIALDCQHLTQTQIATIDSFPVLFILFAFYFMLRFIQSDLLKTKKSSLLVSLGLSGLFMGLSIASKWIGIYAGLGLAVLFFHHCIRTIRNTPEKQKRETFGKIASLCLWCLLFFVAVPLIVYLVSYIPYMAYNQRIRSFDDYLTAVWNTQIGMLNYHSTKGLGMNHPFYSPWWEWPIIGKPMYYASEQYVNLSLGTHYSIFCFGNPVIWFGGLATLLICLFRAIYNMRYETDLNCHRWQLKGYYSSLNWEFLFIGLLAQYLPWVLVPRGTYIYHYFASVPFLILSVVLCVDGLPGKYDKAIQWVCAAFMLMALIAFIVFFPYASGIYAPTAWMEMGKKLLKIWY